MRLRRSGRTAPAVVVAVACLLAGGVLTGAEAQPSLQLPNLLHDGKSATSTTASAEAATAPRGRPPKPTEGDPVQWTGLFGYIDRTKQGVKKAKVNFNLPPMNAFAWIRQVVEQPVDPDYVWADATGKIYATLPRGTGPRFGTFPTVTVSALGFGSVPISADVHITQLKDAQGYPVPFTLTVRFTYALVAPPSPRPCSTPALPSNACLYTEAPRVTGQADVRIDNVKVDGVPVDVGRECHTGTPADITLGAPAGYYSTAPIIYRDPGLYIPLGPAGGGTLSGTVNVPAFSSCGVGGEDLDPLITAMVAGPDNPLTLHQKGTLDFLPHPLP